MQHIHWHLTNSLLPLYRFCEVIKYISSTTAPDAAASVNKNQPGPPSQDRSDGGSGQSTDPAEGRAGSCSPGTAAGAGGSAAGGHEAEKGAPGLGTGERGH